jgi:hypothetical protein
MKTLLRKKAIGEAVPLTGASAMLVLLFDSVLMRPEPDWMGFWLSSILIWLACHLLGRLIGRMAD